MGKIVKFYPAAKADKDTNSNQKATSDQYFGNYSDVFSLMKQIASEIPRFKDRQLLVEKYEKLNELKGHISNRVYYEWLNNLKTDDLENLRKIADGLSMEELISHPAYALPLFHTILEKERFENI